MLHTMSLSALRSATCSIALLACSCRTEPPASPESREVPLNTADPGARGQGAITRGPAGAASPESGLTLDDSLRIALETNPDLSVARKNRISSLAAIEVARRYPYNPTLQTDVRPYAREQSGDQGELFFEAALLQEIELAGQSRHRSRTAAAEVSGAEWILRHAEILTAHETQRLFFSALYWRERRELDASTSQLKDELLDITTRRFEAGLSTASEVALARMGSRSARQQLELTKLHQDAAFAELQKQLGAGRNALLEPTGSLTSFEWSRPRASEVVSGIVDSRPDVKANEARRNAAEARVDLASSERVPNVTLGPVYERDESGTNFLGFKLELPIPVLSTGRPLVRQRQAELEESSEALKQARWKAQSEIESASALYAKAFALADRFRGDLWADLERDIERVQSQFEAGVASLLEAHAARETMAEARLHRLDAAHELALAAADLAEASGVPLEDLLGPPRGEAPGG